MRYTDVELLNIIKNKAKELGRTPKRREISQHNTIRDRFGSWNNAVNKANLKENNNCIYTDEQLIQIVKNKAKELGRTPSLTDIEDISRATFFNRFGSWNNVLKIANLEINHEKTKVEISNEDLIDIYIELCNDLDKFATSRDLDKYCDYKKNVYDARFKGITDLKKLVLHDNRLRISDKTIRERSIKYSDEDLKMILEQIYISNNNNTLGRIDLKNYLENNNLPSINTFFRRFKTTKIKELWNVLEIPFKN